MFSVQTLAILLAAGLAVSPLAARAQTFEMSYTGTDSGYGFTQGTTTGTGSFTLTGGTLTAFSLTVMESAGPGETDTFNWGLADLGQPADFTYTLAGGDITDLSFFTDTVAGYYTPDQFFYLADLLPGDAQTGDFDTGPITIGTLTVMPDSVPEPASLALLGAGVAGLALTRSRKKPALA